MFPFNTTNKSATNAAALRWKSKLSAIATATKLVLSDNGDEEMFLSSANFYISVVVVVLVLSGCFRVRCEVRWDNLVTQSISWIPSL
jgi:hypothetical protein